VESATPAAQALFETGLALSSRKSKYSNAHRLRTVDTVTPHQGNALIEFCQSFPRSSGRLVGKLEVAR
jgi:hypothetical protein